MNINQVVLLVLNIVLNNFWFFYFNWLGSFLIK